MVQFSWWHRNRVFMAVPGVLLVGLGTISFLIYVGLSDAAQWTGVAAFVVPVCIGGWRWLTKLHAQRRHVIESSGASECAVPKNIQHHFRLHRNGCLLRVGEVSDWESLGVHRPIWAGTSGQVPYVERDVDSKLDDLVRNGGVVLLHGPSGSGKSRTAYESIRRYFGDRFLLVPSNSDSLQALYETGFKFRNVVIWLDEVNEYLAGIDSALISSICPDDKSDISIIATIRDVELANASKAIGIDSLSRDALKVSLLGAKWLTNLTEERRIQMVHRLSMAEHSGATQEGTRTGDGRIRAAADAAEGFGVFLVAGNHLWRQWTGNDGPIHARGRALISATVDVRRAGYHQPVASHILADLHECYLDNTSRYRPDLLSDVEEEFGWCATPVLETSSCLIPRGEAYLAADYLLDQSSTDGSPLMDSPIFDQVWDVLLSLPMGPHEAAVIGRNAHSNGRNDVAEQLLRPAAGQGNVVAMASLGAALSDLQKYAEAEVWLRRAAEAGLSESLVLLAIVLDQHGNREEANTWVDLAIEAGDSNAMLLRAAWCMECGNIQDTELWLRRAAELGNTDANKFIGFRLAAQGSYEEAEPFVRKSAGGGHVESMTLLGALLVLRGNHAESSQWLCQAAKAGSIEAKVILGLKSC